MCPLEFTLVLSKLTCNLQKILISKVWYVIKTFKGYTATKAELFFETGLYG